MFNRLEVALSCLVLITQKQAHLTETPTLKKREPQYEPNFPLYGCLEH